MGFIKPGICSNSSSLPIRYRILKIKLTHYRDVRLFEGSPAIDSGSNIDCSSEDQRQVARPQDGTGNMIAICDMGAIEMLLAELVSQSNNSGCTLAARGTHRPLPLYLIIPAIFVLIGLRRRI